MTILHLGHQPGDLSGVAGLISADAGGFDADLDVNAVRIVSARAAAVPFSCAIAAPAGDLWLSFRYRTPSADASEISANGSFLWFDNLGATLPAYVRTLASADGYQAVANGDTLVSGAAWVAASATAYWIDVRVVVGANITIDLYVDGVLVSTATAANAGGKAVPTTITWPNRELHSSGLARTWYYAHIAVRDGVSTLGRRFARRLPDAAATHTDLIGAVADLADADDATRMGSATAAERQSWTLTGPTGPGTGTIAAVHQKLRAQRGASGPQNLRASLRIGGADYDATAQTPPSGAPASLIYSWAENPATTSAWTGGTLPAEAGVLSAT